MRRPAAPLSWVARRNAEYDEMTGELIRRTLARDAVTVDAGANQGLITQQLVRAAPKGRHYAFEPLPHLAARLRRIRHATVFQVALADYTGEATFHYLPDRDGESSLHARPDRTAGLTVVELTVPVRRLDDVLPAGERVDFVKIDVEDAQGALLRGAQDTLARSDPVVVLECHVDDLAESADLLARVNLDIWLMEDYLSGTRRSRSEVEDLAQSRGEWYFVASSRAPG
jgi:FkbM family methyltransferase